MNLSGTEISPGHRYPGGKKKPEVTERRAGHRTLWKRRRTNWALSIQKGEDPLWGSVLGLLYMGGHLTESQADAGRLYAELCAAYDRMNGLPRRTTKSPAYEARYGSDDEVEKHRQNGTILRYERKAKRAAKRWNRALSLIPDDRARVVVDEVCLLDREIPQTQLADLANILGRIAKAFGLLDTEVSHRERKVRQMSAKHKQDRITGFIKALEDAFVPDRVKPTHFHLLMEAPKGERGICVYALHEGKGAVRHAALLKHNGFMPAEMDAMLLKACEAKGWVERPYFEGG